MSGGAALADEHPADVCFEIAPELLGPGDWETVGSAVDRSVAQRPALFPSPRIARTPTRLDIDSGHLTEERGHGSCLVPGFEWTSRFEREFIVAGADQLFEEAPKTPGFSSSGTIEWYPEENRLRTRLQFSGPLGIPNGACWVDDVLTVDDATGAVGTSRARDLDTSPFGSVVCDRFFSYLPDGGAGEQTVSLLPESVALADGSELRFVVRDVVVAEDALVVSGRLQRD
ncbi:MAG: hypothetical protein AB1Z63_09970 [Candidatus Limnocylindrales bacterium]